MNQTELNLYFIQAILYYCFQQNAVYFDVWASDVGSWGYDEDSNLIISEWFVDGSPYNIPQPDKNTLMSYSAQTVIDFHNANYLYPSDVKQNQAFLKLSTSQINSIPVVLFEKGTIIFDTTKLWPVIFDGTQFNDL